MGIMSVEQMDRLFWLGRYTERVYTTIRIFEKRYDSLIEASEVEYKEFCKKQDIPDIYSSKQDFLIRYCFDEKDQNSIYSNLMRGYDNAIVLREEIGSETLAYIQLAVYEMEKARISQAPMIEMQKVLDNLVAFWGIADDSIDQQHVRNIIKVGKRVERIDLYARMHMEGYEIEREVARLTDRIPRSGLNYDKEKIIVLNELAASDKPDYKKIVENIETLI